MLRTNLISLQHAVLAKCNRVVLVLIHSNAKEPIQFNWFSSVETLLKLLAEPIIVERQARPSGAGGARGQRSHHGRTGGVRGRKGGPGQLDREQVRGRHQTRTSPNRTSRRHPRTCRCRGRKPAASKWVYTLKYNRDGSISRYKARFVVCGYSQIKGLDYEHAFSATLRATSFRTLLAIASGLKLKLGHIDVSNAFTQANLDDVDIWIEAPKGMPVGSDEFGKQILKLKRALYGAKQSSRLQHAVDVCKHEVGRCNHRKLGHESNE